jgi:hypothetical protein
VKVVVSKIYKNSIAGLKQALAGILPFFTQKEEYKADVKLRKDYKLYSLRVLNGFSRKEAAKYLGVSYPGYCYYEIGKLEPTPERFYDILEARLSASD